MYVATVVWCLASMYLEVKVWKQLRNDIVYKSNLLSDKLQYEYLIKATLLQQCTLQRHWSRAKIISRETRTVMVNLSFSWREETDSIALMVPGSIVSRTKTPLTIDISSNLEWLWNTMTQYWSLSKLILLESLVHLKLSNE